MTGSCLEVIMSTEINIAEVSFNEEGTITATINPVGAIAECSRNNTAYIYCGIARFKFFTIDYYVWVK